MRKWKKGLASLLSAAMLVSALPLGAFATEPQPSPAVAAEQALPDQTEKNGSQTKPSTDWMQMDTISREEMDRLVALVPLKTEEIEIDCSSYTPAELNMLPVSKVLEGQNVDAGVSIAWAKDYMDTYTVTDLSGTIALFNDTYLSPSNQYIDLDLIVGSAKQLDATNIHYKVKVKINKDLGQWLNAALYTQGDDGTRWQVSLAKTEYTGTYLRMYVYEEDLSWDAKTYIGLTENFSFNENYDTVQIYEGTYDDFTNGTANDITSQIWNQDMTAADSGYLMNRGSISDITLITKKDEAVVGYLTFMVYKSWAGPRIEALHDGVKKNEYSNYHMVSRGWRESRSEDGILTYTYMLYSGYSPSSDYYLRFSFYSTDLMTNDSVELAVVGNYATKEDAISAGAIDIKDVLFGETGYCADFSAGVPFSIFAEGKTFRYVICTAEGDTEETSLSGNTFFDVNGAKELPNRAEKVYSIPYEHDQYCRNGFQTLLVLDEDVDLSSLTPVFSNMDNVTIYTAGSSIPEVSGESVHDFSAGPVQYSASAENMTSRKEYWVTFVKKETSGPKLFVNAINGPQGAKREVFLDNYSGTYHDIFIANVGNAPLTGLTAELNASNVKLDPYWTVGGERNNTLAAFETVEPSFYRDSETGRGVYDSHSELPSTAKIRLIPDGNGKIEGTLTISADGQEPVVITLTGTAGDPMITTEEIPFGVKYVPYGSMIQTSNLYDWNELTFTLEDGELPAGVEIRPNGEIYGVPKEVGSFTFTVKMQNSIRNFRDCHATFTLEVLENTDENVDASTSEGYAVLDRIPDLIIPVSDGGNTAPSNISAGDVIRVREMAEPVGMGENGLPDDLYSSEFRVREIAYSTNFSIVVGIDSALLKIEDVYLVRKSERAIDISLGDTVMVRSGAKPLASSHYTDEFTDEFYTRRYTVYRIDYPSDDQEITVDIARDGTPIAEMKMDDLYLIDSAGQKPTGGGSSATNSSVVVQDQVFRSEGAFEEFIDLWLDGEKLVRERDYTVESGSTKSVLKGKTLEKLPAGTHTISMEYRENGDPNQGLKKAAQNFRKEYESANQGNTNQGSTSQGNTSQGSTNQGNTSQGSTNQGNTSQGSTNQGNTSQGSTNQGNTSQGSTNQGNTSQGSTSQGTTAAGNWGNLQVGDIVTFTGTVHYYSATSTTPHSCTPGRARVSGIYPSGTHPIQLIALRGEGSTVYGWVSPSDIAEINEEQALDSGAPIIPSIVPGSLVTIKSGARNYTGGLLAWYVYTLTFTVIQVSGDQAIIGIDGGVILPMNINDIVLKEPIIQ